MNEPIFYGFRKHTGVIVLDNTWKTIDDVMRGMHGHGFKNMRDEGVLIQFVNNEWEEVPFP